MPEFQKAYERKRVALDFSDTVSMTEQKHKQECDINYLLERFDKTKVLNFRSENVGQFGFATSQSFQDAMYLVAKGNSMFEEVPSHIRAKFDNSPAKFLDFVQNPDNADKMVKMGLARNRDDIPSKVTQNEVFEVIRNVVKEAKASESPPPAGSE